MEGGYEKEEEKKEAHLVEELCGFSKLSVAQEGSQQLEQVHQELGVHVPTLHTHTQHVSMLIVSLPTLPTVMKHWQMPHAKPRVHKDLAVLTKDTQKARHNRQPSPPKFFYTGYDNHSTKLTRTATGEQTLKLTCIQKGTQLNRRKWQNITVISFFSLSHSPPTFKMGQVNPNTKVLSVAEISPTITQTGATIHATKMAVSCNQFSYPLSWGQGQETTDEDAMRDQLHPREGKSWRLGWAQNVEHLAEEEGNKLL